MSEKELVVDPGFVHHRKVETILQEGGTKVINQKISEIPATTPDWRKNVVIDHIYTRVMLEFCKGLKIKTLDQVLLEGNGHLFCSVIKTKACPELYDSERVSLKCEAIEGSEYEVELELTTKRISGDTLRSKLHQGGEFAVVAEFSSVDGHKLIFSPLIIGFPYMSDKKTGELAWEKYSDHYNLHIEDFDEFSKIKDTAMPSSFDDMKNIKENVFKEALGKILSESTPKDWGGETSDFVTSHLHIKGERVSAAFLLKGPAKFNPMTVKHLGKNGDQIVRLAQEPVDVLFVQHCHDITSSVKETLKAFATQPSNPRYYCLLDGRESLRLLEAFDLKQWAIDESA